MKCFCRILVLSFCMVGLQAHADYLYQVTFDPLTLQVQGNTYFFPEDALTFTTWYLPPVISGVEDNSGLVVPSNWSFALPSPASFDGSSFSTVDVSGEWQTESDGVSRLESLGITAGSNNDRVNGTVFDVLAVIPYTGGTGTFSGDEFGRCIWINDGAGCQYTTGEITITQTGPVFDPRVPEPSTITLLASGFAGLACAFRKKGTRSK